MPRFDASSGCLSFKIVLCGPGQSGKTAVLRGVHRMLPPARRGELLCLSTETERTLFFDFFPVYLGEVDTVATEVRLDLYTVPGQVFYEEARRIVAKDADGIVFVADSRSCREDANAAALRELNEVYKRAGDGTGVPMVMLYNKRDAADRIPLPRLRELLNREGLPEFEAVATAGIGLTEMLDRLCELVLQSHLARAWG